MREIISLCISKRVKHNMLHNSFDSFIMLHTETQVNASQTRPGQARPGTNPNWDKLQFLHKHTFYAATYIANATTETKKLNTTKSLFVVIERFNEISPKGLVSNWWIVFLFFSGLQLQQHLLWTRWSSSFVINLTKLFVVLLIENFNIYLFSLMQRT